MERTIYVCSAIKTNNTQSRWRVDEEKMKRRWRDSESDVYIEGFLRFKTHESREYFLDEIERKWDKGIMK